MVLVEMVPSRHQFTWLVSSELCQFLYSKSIILYLKIFILFYLFIYIKHESPVRVNSLHTVEYEELIKLIDKRCFLSDCKLIKSR